MPWKFNPFTGTLDYYQPQGSSAHTHVWNEVPSGTIDGTNKTFTLAHTPDTGSLLLFLNGILEREGASYDYTLSGGTITMAVAPPAGSTLLCSYTY